MRKLLLSLVSPLLVSLVLIAPAKAAVIYEYEGTVSGTTYSFAAQADQLLAVGESTTNFLSCSLNGYTCTEFYIPNSSGFRVVFPNSSFGITFSDGPLAIGGTYDSPSTIALGFPGFGVDIIDLVSGSHVLSISEVASVPEPGSIALLGLALAGLSLVRRRRAK